MPSWWPLSHAWPCLIALASVAACANPVPLPPKAVQLNRLGAAALEEGDLATAEARLAVAIEYSPKFTEAWVNLGLVALRRGDLRDARKQVGHARSLNPDLPAPHHAMGLIEESGGRWKKAEACYRAALKVDPGFAPSRSNLGRLLFSHGRFDEAREQFLRLTEVAPDTLEGWLGLAEAQLRLGDERGSDMTTHRARLRFGDPPDLLVLVARQMMRRGAFADAEETLAPLTAVADRRRRARAWAWLAVARLGGGSATEAGVAADEALAMDPEDPVARYVLYRTGRL
jgi:Tfp pilus assembly protein PilF